MRFAHAWRPYQRRILEELPDFLENHHFHLVSAPGSGKTVAGLEVLRRVGKPTLVLAPTVAIREQWIDRLAHDFLGGRRPDWISRSLTEPGDLTVGTYQSLGSEFRKEQGMETVLAAFESAGISTLVVDEAHHLRAFWWRCLATMKEALPDPTIIALTATPPIDVPAAEWNRYASFCGPVDIEVGVPELVGAGNLCPHQDFVHFSMPSPDDARELERFHAGVSRFLADLQIDVAFAEQLGRHSPIDWIGEEDGDDFLKQHQPFLLALAIYLRATGGYLPESLREALDLDGEELPGRLDTGWAELLLQGLLFDFRERIESTDGLSPNLLSDLKSLEEKLRDLGAIEKGRVLLRGNRENERILRDSTAKLDSVAQIIDHEIQAQGALMRCVVLTDHIRRDAFPSPGEIDPPLVKLGVVPIFERLRRIGMSFLTPGILTGSLTVIPRRARQAFAPVAFEKGIGPEGFTLTPLDHDPAFLAVDVRDRDRQRLVAVITELFAAGEINCLVGTASLLGEGWDAPALNTLVLASVVGSFVMSNQMRGRAIRSDPDVEKKIANIWHVATISPAFRSGENGETYDPGPDFAKLARRFEAFHGVGFDLDEDGDALVENGWQRLGVDGDLSPDRAAELNRRMFHEAEHRENTEFIWKRAIDPILEGRFLRPVRELETPRKLAASRFIARIGGERERGFRHDIAGWLEKRRLRRIAGAIYLSLSDEGLIDAPFSRHAIVVDVNSRRSLVTAPFLDPASQVTMITSLDEFFDVFNAPRYLVHQRDRYYAVPSLLDENRETVDRFSHRLRSRGFGRHEMIYIHSREGRAHLLEARKRRLLNFSEFRTETRIAWQALEETAG